MKHILMVCYGGGHMKVLAPLYAELCGRYQVTVLALTSAGAYMRELGIPSLGFRDFDFIRSTEIQAYGRMLAADVPDNSLVPYEETVAYLGASFFDLVKEVGDEEAAQELYRKKGRAAFLPVATLEQIIAQLKVDAVITTNSPRAERAALIAAKATGLPTVCVNDNLWIQSGAAEVAESRLADRICVLSDSVKNELLSKNHVAAATVEVTGTPVFDAIKQIARIPRTSNLPRVLLADCDIPEVLPFLDLHNATPGIAVAVRQELNRLAGNKFIDVYFRPHPNQVYDYSDYPACQVSTQQESLQERLANTDVVITAISTVGIEAKVMGLGLVSIENTVYSTLESYARLGLSTGIVTAEELWGAICKEEAANARSCGHSLYEGVASENISAVIDRLLL